MSPKVQELLLYASHSRSEALSLDWSTEEKMTFSLLSDLLGKIADSKQGAREAPSVAGTEIKMVEEYILGDNGESLPTRIV